MVKRFTSNAALAALGFILGFVVTPHAAQAQVAAGCYNGMIGNGASQGNVISSVTANSTTSLTVSSGCTPVITLGPTISAADVTSLGTNTAAIAAAYINSLVATTYGFPATSALSGYSLTPSTVAGITATPTAFGTTPAIASINTGTAINGIGASFSIGPSTASGTAGNSANLYFVANTATAGTVVAPYMYAGSNGNLNFKLLSPATISTNNASIALGSGFIALGGEHNNNACGQTPGVAGTGVALASGTSGAPIALGNQGPNCVGTFNGSGKAYYSFSDSNLGYPCVTGTTEYTTGTPSAIGASLVLATTTWDLTFTSANATDANTFSFHLAGCPN